MAQQCRNMGKRCMNGAGCAWLKQDKCYFSAQHQGSRREAQLLQFQRANHTQENVIDAEAVQDEMRFLHVENISRRLVSAIEAKLHVPCLMLAVGAALLRLVIGLCTIVGIKRGRNDDCKTWAVATHRFWRARRP